MNKREQRQKNILDFIESNGGIATKAELVNAGATRMLLEGMVNRGQLVREAKGYYTSKGHPLDAYKRLQIHSPKLVFSYVSALYLNGLIDDEPEEYHVTVPQGYNVMKIKEEFDCIVFHYSQPETWNIGIEKVITPGGFEVQCYDPERCICDCIRARGKIDKITYVRAMKRYFGALKDPSRILHYAQRLKVKREAEMYAEVLMPEENIV